MSSDPLIVFGAFDRHNFGDLLFPHVAEALLPGRELVFAGVARRDLRAFGGHQVESIVALAKQRGERPANVLHIGGEILTVDAWQAAVMVLPADDVGGVIGLYERRRSGLGWPGHRAISASITRRPMSCRGACSAVPGAGCSAASAAWRWIVAKRGCGPRSRLSCTGRTSSACGMRRRWPMSSPPESLRI